MELPTNFFNHDAQAGGFYPLSHVGIDITGFGKNQNVLIEGIRGTGKTHVLRMIERYYFENFINMRVLPIFVSLAQISEHARKDPNEFRLHLYTHIVQRCLETIETYKDDLQPDKNLLTKAIDSIRKMFGLSIEPNIIETISNLKETAINLQTELQFDLTSETFTKSIQEGSSATTKQRVGIETKYPQLLKAGFDEEFASRQDIQQSSEGRLMLMGSRLAHHNAVNFIIEFLKQVQIMLNLEYSLILLDECSEASFSSQVEVFRLFKTIRGTNSRLSGKSTCAFFIGAVYPIGETYYPNREQDGFSFEPGHDCTMEYLQWDETDLASYESFFREMTLNRAKEILSYKTDFNNLVLDIFENEETFQLAAYSAHGIPRRYWEIVKRGYDQSSKRILLSRVGIAVQEIVNDQILAHKSISEEDINFIYLLVSLVSGTNREIRSKNKKSGKPLVPQNIYFSVNRRYKEVLRRLIMQGAIHDKSRMRTISKPKRPQPIFAVDIAVVYTFRIIPPKNIVTVIRRDLPRCPTNDFDQAPEIWPREIKEVYEQGMSFVLPENVPEDEDIAIPQIDQELEDSESTNKDIKKKAKNNNLDSLQPSQNSFIGGIVRSYQPNRYGLIEVFDGGSYAYFSSDQVEEKYRDTLQPDDHVEFNLVVTPKGRQAINIFVPELTVFVLQDQLQRLSTYVVETVKSSDSPISLAILASQIRNYFGDNIINTQWFGFGKFKNLLQHLDLGNLEFSPEGPSYIFDPGHHNNPHEINITAKSNIFSVSEFSDNIKRLFLENVDEDGWKKIGDLMDVVRKEDPEFDYINYGFKKFISLLQATNLFIFKTRLKEKDLEIEDIYIKLK